MIKSKRFNNLKLLKEKKLNKVIVEINTLNNEISKSNSLKNKLRKIKSNSFIEKKHNNSTNILYKYEFERKLLEQIEICENRVLFLKKELLIAKNKLGKLVSQKKLIEEKIKYLFIEELKVKEEKLLKNAPVFRKG